MDSLTQIALGAAVGELTLGRGKLGVIKQHYGADWPAPFPIWM